ncbi:MAG: hypothetical protein JO337_00765 [Acidimicrobiales bacterium]|nr:hypothetical protein [Acidimicrobiales bacterium]
MSDVAREPVPDHPGISRQLLVDNIDPGGSTLLGVRYEAGSADRTREHSVGQVILVIEGELNIDGKVCGPGAGCYAPSETPYSIEAVTEATAVEFRPAPIVYGTGLPDSAKAKAWSPTPPAASGAVGWDLMQGAGPVTSVKDFSYFDIYSMPESQIAPDMSIQALVNHAEDDGQSMLMVRHWPGEVTPAHSHDVEQIVVVLEGSISQGNRTFVPGTGFFTPEHKKYGLQAGPDGVVRVEWRPSPLRFATDWVEG